jgi:hypothetical protein
VREMAGDASFMASLLSSLSPSLSPSTPCIAAVVTGLQVWLHWLELCLDPQCMRGQILLCSCLRICCV